MTNRASFFKKLIVGIRQGKIEFDGFTISAKLIQKVGSRSLFQIKIEGSTLSGAKTVARLNVENCSGANNRQFAIVHQAEIFEQLFYNCLPGYKDNIEFLNDILGNINLGTAKYLPSGSIRLTMGSEQFVYDKEYFKINYDSLAEQYDLELRSPSISSVLMAERKIA